MAVTAWNDGCRVLCHWQCFNEKRLRNALPSHRGPTHFMY